MAVITDESLSRMSGESGRALEEAVEIGTTGGILDPRLTLIAKGGPLVC